MSIYIGCISAKYRGPEEIYHHHHQHHYSTHTHASVHTDEGQKKWEAMSQMERFKYLDSDTLILGFQAMLGNQEVMSPPLHTVCVSPSPLE